MKICCVGGCGLTSKDVMLFEFPSSRLLRKRWLDVINTDKKVGQDDLVCLHHFKVDDYEDIRGKTRLKAKVVPSVFGKQASTAQTKDPLGLLGGRESKASTKDADNHNGNVDHDKINSDNENVNKDNENVNNVNECVNKDYSDNDRVKIDNNGEHSNKETTANENITDNGQDNNNREENSDNEKRSNSGEETTKSDNRESKKRRSPDKNLEGNGDRKSNRKSSDNDNVVNNEDNDSVQDNSTVQDNGTVKDNDTVKDNVKDNGTVKDNDNIKDNETVIYNKDNENLNKAKKVKKKWVPMIKGPRGNGKVELSEDSSSQDSINSELPIPPVLEDLEEHLPNYQIANMKTERQVAAMTLTEDPVQDCLRDQDVEMVITPHVPVFIELSVGQDNSEGTETTNDCLMVVESVQCDVDPALLLEARLEDEDCCEQIDIDDDDDDDVVETTVESLDTKRKRSKEKTPKKPKPASDPISLLTSSDEDDVIIQEPHIDTLSVSDETDEDDVPLQKLIKREKKNKKNKKTTKKDKTKKLPENLNEIFLGTSDYYCMHCGNVSISSAEHQNHLKTHSSEKTKPRARIYQICKECGHTTASKSQLNRHMRKHLNEKKYKCPLCSYRSKYNMSLLYHLKTHEFDPNKYNCGSCGVKLESKKQLLEHQKCCTEMDDKFMCSTCGYIARNKRDLKGHMNRVHKK